MKKLEDFKQMDAKRAAWIANRQKDIDALHDDLAVLNEQLEAAIQADDEAAVMKTSDKISQLQARIEAQEKIVSARIDAEKDYTRDEVAAAANNETEAANKRIKAAVDAYREHKEQLRKDRMYIKQLVNEAQERVHEYLELIGEGYTARREYKTTATGFVGVMFPDEASDYGTNCLFFKT